MHMEWMRLAAIALTWIVKRIGFPMVCNGIYYPCSEAYCLRKNKNTGNVYCRFHFLYSLQDEPVIAKPPFSSFYRLYLALNCYNKAADQHGLAGQYRPVISTPVS